MANYQVILATDQFHTLFQLIKSEYDQDIKFNELHDIYAPEAMKLILDMGGFYIKIGQMGSIRDDFVPQQYMKGLKMLQSDVPYQPICYVKKVVSEQLGVKFDDVFSEIDEIPLGSASIGQVHRAVLRESGQEVVVKIQYPNVEDTFRFDMKTIMDWADINNHTVIEDCAQSTGSGSGTFGHFQDRSA